MDQIDVEAIRKGRAQIAVMYIVPTPPPQTDPAKNVATHPGGFSLTF